MNRQTSSLIKHLQIQTCVDRLIKTDRNTTIDDRQMYNDRRTEIQTDKGRKRKEAYKD